MVGASWTPGPNASRQRAGRAALGRDRTGYIEVAPKAAGRLSKLSLSLANWCQRVDAYLRGYFLGAFEEGFRDGVVRVRSCNGRSLVTAFAHGDVERDFARKGTSASSARLCPPP